MGFRGTLRFRERPYLKKIDNFLSFTIHIEEEVRDGRG
jgi:hypothetical protein